MKNYKSNPHTSSIKDSRFSDQKLPVMENEQGGFLLYQKSKLIKLETTMIQKAIKQTMIWVWICRLTKTGCST